MSVVLKNIKNIMISKLMSVVCSIYHNWQMFVGGGSMLELITWGKFLLLFVSLPNSKCLAHEGNMEMLIRSSVVCYVKESEQSI